MFVCVCQLLQSCLTLCDSVNLAHQAPLSVEFSRQEYWSGLPFHSPGIFPTQGFTDGFFTTELPGNPQYICMYIYNSYSCFILEKINFPNNCMLFQSMISICSSAFIRYLGFFLSALDSILLSGVGSKTRSLISLPLLGNEIYSFLGFPIGSAVKNLPAVQEMQV